MSNTTSPEEGTPSEVIPTKVKKTRAKKVAESAEQPVDSKSTPPTTSYFISSFVSGKSVAADVSGYDSRVVAINVFSLNTPGDLQAVASLLANTVAKERGWTDVTVFPLQVSRLPL